MDKFALDDVLDKDILEGIQRLKAVPGFPVGAILSGGLRPFVEMFLPLADLYEQGCLTQNLLSEYLTADNLREALKEVDSLVIKSEVARARVDKNIKKLLKLLEPRGN